MKLKWSILKGPTMRAFRMFKNHRRTNFMLGVQPLYDCLHTQAIARVPEPGSATETFEASKRAWAADARSYCVSPKHMVREKGYDPETDKITLELLPPKTVPDSAKGIYAKKLNPAVALNARLQVKDSKFDWPEHRLKQLRPEAEIEAVAVDLDVKSNTRSRINIVVRPECTGQPLFKKFCVLSMMLNRLNSTSSGAICTWKVMNPILGSESPESAVIYFSEPLADAKVWHVITVLSDFFHSELVALTNTPFGMIKIRDGIYGCDLPDENTEKRAFDNNTSRSSAHRLMSMILCKAGWEAAKNLEHEPEVRSKDTGASQKVLEKFNSKVLTVEQEETCVKAYLDLVLRELGWKLED